MDANRRRGPAVTAGILLIIVSIIGACMEADPVYTIPADVDVNEDEGLAEIADGPIEVVATDEPIVPTPSVVTPTASDDENTTDGAPANDVTVTAAPVGSAALPQSSVPSAVGEDPPDWLDTAANNSMRQDDSQFAILETAGEKVFGTLSTASNIHSHFVGVDSSDWADYTLTGRMMISDPAGGIGVTFLSDYPNTDSYYRIRCVADSTFHVAPHPWDILTITDGVGDSGVAPLPNKWYRFRIQVEDDSSQTLIRARIWLDGTTESTDWQIDCYDSSTNRRTSGTVGVWSHGPGLKWWDDLDVVPGQVDHDPPPPPSEDPPPSSDDDPPSSPALPATIVNGVYEFTGQLGPIGFNIYTDQEISWWFYDVTMNGNGADSTLFAVGKDCRIERSTFFGSKHGIRIASVDGLSISDCDISSNSLYGHGIKLCGIGDRGPSSRNVTIENCTIRGGVAIRPMNEENALIEHIENVTLRNCTIKPYGNVGVGIAAKNVRCENVTIDFREADAWAMGCTGFDVTNYYGCMPQDVTITGDNRMILRSGQTGTLIVSDIPINP